MYFIADMYCTRCHFDIYTLTWYIDEKTLHILSLMVWNQDEEVMSGLYNTNDRLNLDPSVAALVRPSIGHIG
jgi:hypothetical protein